MDASPLAGWDNFYVIIGSTAGGLTGLTFVVIALIRDAGKVSPAGLGAFVTPTIVHFSGVLGMAAFLSMPHQRLASLSAGFAITGVAGLLYTVFIVRGMRAQLPSYLPVWEDWIFNAIVPGLIYAGLVVVAVLIGRWPEQSLFAVAAMLLVALFVGIHNAWDIAVWMTTRQTRSKD